MSVDRALKILEAFSGVEEDLLERCESAVVSVTTGLQEKPVETGSRGEVISLAERIKKNFKKSSWRYGSAVAAVLCLAIVGLASVGGLRMTTNDTAAYEAVMDATSGGAGMAVNTTGTVATSSAATSSEETSTEPGMRETDSGVEVFTATSEKAEGIVVTESEKDSQQKLGTAPVEDNITNGTKAFTYVVVAEDEARAHETFGAYVPTKLPNGYVLEGAYVSGEGEAASLMVSWSRGLDSIKMNITLPQVLPETIDVAKTETYDEYLYDIPQAETVPEDYREVFDNPVCAWEDFSLEFVQKRMIVREDSGDTATPRGNFSVLYPDGVLVYFNGRGTAEEIWELFNSMDVNK